MPCLIFERHLPAKRHGFYEGSRKLEAADVAVVIEIEVLGYEEIPAIALVLADFVNDSTVIELDLQF